MAMRNNTLTPLGSGPHLRGHEVGVVLPVDLPAEEIPYLSQRVEDAGFDHIWAGEDFFFNGGIATLATILGSTQQISAGVGIFAAVVRHPALLAMELTTLGRIYQGRVVAGLGLGHVPWLKQMGLMPGSPLTAVRSAIESIKSLFDGNEVDGTQAPFEFNNIRLDLRPNAPIPIYLGAWGPKMLQLGGAIADGVLIAAELGGPGYVEWAKQQVSDGARAAHREPPPILCFSRFCVDQDAVVAQEMARPVLADLMWTISQSGGALRHYGKEEELEERLDRQTRAEFVDSMPIDLVQGRAIVGDEAEAARQIASLHASGAEGVILYGIPTEHERKMLTRAGDNVLPLVRNHAEKQRKADEARIESEEDWR